MKSCDDQRQHGAMRFARAAKLLEVVLASLLVLSSSSFAPGQQVEVRDLPASPRAAQSPPSSSHDAHWASRPAETSAPRADAGLTPVSYTASGSGATVAVSYQLRRANWREFESNLVTCWLTNPQYELLAGGQQVRVLIPHRKATATMTIDRATSALTFYGPERMADEWQQLMSRLDYTANQAPGKAIRAVDMRAVSPTVVKQAAYLMGLQQDDPAAGNLQDAAPLPQLPGQQPTVVSEFDPNQDVVQITVYPELNLIILRGKPEDVARVRAQLDALARDIEIDQPQVKRVELENADPTQAAESLRQVYDANYSAALGPASIIAVPYPPSLLLIGRPQAIMRLEQLIEQIDLPPLDRPAEKDFKTYELRFMSAVDAKQRLDEYFSQAQQLTIASPPQALPVVTIADYRSNKLVVKASKAYLDQVDELLNVLDVENSSGGHAVRIFPLRNTLSTDLQPILQYAVTGELQNAPRGFNPSPNQFAQQQQQQQLGQLQQGQNQSRQFASPLQLMTLDRDGRLVRSSILFEVRVVAVPANNSLVIVGPPGAMDLVAALIDQLDRLPDAESQIKVFEIVNGDAQTLLTTLQALFATQQQGGLQAFGLGGATTQLPLQTSGATDGATIINVRFSVDARTNSIIASGAVGDLQVVESLLLRLDQESIDRRVSYTYRLSNAPAPDVATAVTEWLNNRRNLITGNPEFTGQINQARRDVYVTADANSNTLIISALPEYLTEVVEVVRALDRRPPVIKVSVLIAEVNLSMLEELGVDIGVQDSILYDRGLGVIGFPFNQAGIGNNNIARENLAGQALSNLGTGRTNPELGYGGLVLSAGNESINLLLRALKDKQCLRTLSRPQLAMLENVAGSILVGERVAYVTSVNQTAFGLQNGVEFQEVGIRLDVTSRVSEDGMIILNVVVAKDALGAEDQGTVIFVTNDGTSLRVPRISTTTATTTIMARSGQTVVFSGLIQETTSRSRRGAPILSDLPIVGPLFRFERERAVRSELLIIMTPYLMYGDDDIDAHNYHEMDRMHWCLSDVANIYGSVNYGTSTEYGSPLIFYPDEDPAGVAPQSFGQTGNR